MAKNFTDYKKDIMDDISTCIENMGCQPILFIGSGLSRRFFNAPSWEELLIEMAKQCPKIDKAFAYYKQSYNDLIDIGTIFSECYKEWAWSEGEKKFPKELFNTNMPPEIYLKFKVSKFFKEITPENFELIEDENIQSEIKAIKEIRPHAIITTNYDNFLEKIFNDYKPIIGQQLLRKNHDSIGEIFKIHGCLTTPNSLVLTRKDYDEFMLKKKYLSAKLLTYFAEHPLLFIGYNAEDPNIKHILSDIDEILSSDNELIPNIYFLDWKNNINENEYPAKEKIILTDTGKTIRIKNISASSFKWVFEAFGTNNALEKVNPKLLRALLARTYELVRKDIPTKTVDVDYKILEHAIESDDGLAKIYGITTLSNPTALNATYPYTLTDVAKELGFKSWYYANQLIQKVIDDKNINIKNSDNNYHVAIKAGSTTQTHKYSEATIDLLKKVTNKDSYELEL